MIHAIKLGNLGVVAKNYEAMVDYYTAILGFELVERTADASYLRIGTDHYAIRLQKSGGKIGLEHVGFQIDRKYSSADVVNDLSSAGIAGRVEKDSRPGISELVSFSDADGTRIELYTAINHPSKTQKPVAIAPRKLGHVARGVTDVKSTCSYYEARLGFRVSDWIEDFFVFLRCSPDHHTVNFISSPTANLHHIAYEVSDWSHIQRACDILAEHRIPLIWGPLRHGPGHNIATYHLDPDGNRIELFCELDSLLDERLGYFEARPWHEDNPQRPKVWKRDDYWTANSWGIGPTETFRR